MEAFHKEFSRSLSKNSLRFFSGFPLEIYPSISLGIPSVILPDVFQVSSRDFCKGLSRNFSKNFSNSSEAISPKISPEIPPRIFPGVPLEIFLWISLRIPSQLSLGISSTIYPGTPLGGLSRDSS